MGYWRCKKHKENCRSYILSIVKDLNDGKEVQRGFMELVEFVE